ncbi:NAD-dependent protein deacylase [Utexia brackfieldae]|uniref:Sir2 family NAD+-dependent deacetylase n=1 Tax=Utexia brackfieldae TaxID=3074108 RepID=UPI00370D3AB8
MLLPKIVILTGAGISAESGLATFRAEDGLWEGQDVNDVATYEGYQRNPVFVQQFYNRLRRQLQTDQIKPNLAHQALARLERYFGSDNVLLVTQNVDNLHERAGSQNIIHMHGELLKARDEQTDEVIACYEDIDPILTPNLRPHIVWFGEIPLEMARIYQALAKTDYFISIGTSGHVYPAAGFVQTAREHDSQTIELNLAPSLGQNLFETKIYGPATQVVPDFITQLIEQYPSAD